jgi:hypothetical protein
MSKNGGKRPGAGRKKGGKNRHKRRTISVTLLAGGVLPLEMVLKTARYMWAHAVNEDGEIKDLAQAIKAAQFGMSAIPFTSHRLQAINHAGLNNDEKTPGAAQMAQDTIALAKQLMRQHLPPGATHPAVSD